MTNRESRRILVLGAHPDDCDIFAGGSAVLWRDRGDEVLFVSLTNGDAGHFEGPRDELALRRRRESELAGRILDVEYRVLDYHDGELVPDLRTRKDIVRIIRSFEPDLVLTHRPNDYHPDHRYASLLVQDSAYMVTVPLFCPDTPALNRNPVIAYLFDEFRRPVPFRPDVVVEVDRVIETKFDALACHESQFFEWLAHCEGRLDEVPRSDEARREWLVEVWEPYLLRPAKTCAEAVRAEYGVERAADIRHVEAFELCEFGRQPDADELRELFPIDS